MFQFLSGESLRLVRQRPAPDKVEAVAASASVRQTLTENEENLFKLITHNSLINRM